MSRIGKQPIAFPGGVKVQVAEGKVRVEGPKGKLELAYHPNMKVELDDKGRTIQVTRPDDERLNRSLHGLTRSLIANMVEGVTKGYEKRLKIEGIGYQARMDKKTIVLTVGYANAIELTSRRWASSRPRSARPASPSRTRARASATRTSRCAARRASPSPAAANVDLRLPIADCRFEPPRGPCLAI
jgi:Ribosomal protein L6